MKDIGIRKADNPQVQLFQDPVPIVISFRVILFEMLTSVHFDHETGLVALVATSPS
ncbi:MAG TPA: hypothetical protein VGG06_11720 [Thermoanaerobaculia bacterium]|jgi:hypothetical protein